MYFEASRGCWWGQRSHCTFCGLNGEYINYRSKSGDRVLNELLQISRKHGILEFDATDNILNPSFLSSLIPRLRETGFDFRLFFEVKAAMTKNQVKLLADAGVSRVQPGIESFSTHVLNLMKKGTTMLQNIQALKWLEEAHIAPLWNLIYGFPGETDQDYSAMESLLPRLFHLPPPGGFGRISMHRFSPNFDFAKSFGFENLAPWEDYRYLYPTLDEEELQGIAYFFKYDLEGFERFLPHVEHLRELVRTWRIRYRAQPRLKFSFGIGPEFIKVMDQRKEGTLDVYKLRGQAMTVFLYCDKIRSSGEIEAFLQGQPRDSSKSSAMDTVENLCKKGLLLREGNLYLALPVALKPVWD